MSTVEQQKAPGMILDQKLFTKLSSGDQIYFDFEAGNVWFLRNHCYLRRSGIKADRKVNCGIFSDDMSTDDKHRTAFLVANLVAYSHGMLVRINNKNEHRIIFEFFIPE